MPQSMGAKGSYGDDKKSKGEREERLTNNPFDEA